MPTVAELTKSIERLLEQIRSATGQEQGPLAKRAIWRHKWATAATLQVLDSEDSSEPLYVTTRTICAEGLDCYAAHKLERGCKVLINLGTDEGELQIPATVKHSIDSVGMPIVGVTFDP